MSDQNMPDFDSMTPEEVMAWMETLARRQGGDARGFTTDKVMDVPEIDPNTVDTSSMGEYIPHGWTKERWEQQLAKEAAEREARGPAQPAPRPAAPPPPPAPEPAPVAATSAPAADATPDFDSMTPEEMMAWMETLARRQGGDERGFTTDKIMDVPEIDPSTVDTSSMGDYIPHGWTKERWEQQLAKEAAERETRTQQPPAAKAIPTPAAPPPPPPPAPEPVMSLPLLEEDEPDDFTTVAAEPLGDDDPMSWLSELAAGESSGLPDFSALEIEAEAPPVMNFQEEEVGDPLAWLAGLAAETESPLPTLPPEPAAPISPPAAVASPIDTGDDPVEWLESLARRQGATEDELSTDADIDIPLPAGINREGPGYTDYSFESPAQSFLKEDEEESVRAGFDAAALDMEDPGAWLEAVARGSGASPKEEIFIDDIDEEDDQAIIEGLRSGTIDPASMEAFFNRQFDKALERDEAEEADPNAPAIPAELPDWLMEQMQVDPPTPPPAPEPAPILSEEIFEPAPVSEMPDWLSSAAGESAPDDISDIFADSGEIPAVPKVSTSEVELEATDDPWVEAFIEEAKLAPGEVPNWYKERLAADTNEIAGWEPTEEIEEIEEIEEFEEPEETAAPDLFVSRVESSLPAESDLQPGQPEAVPSWLDDSVPVSAHDWTPGAQPSIAPLSEAMPDWLMDDAAQGSSELPNWLLDTSINPEEVPDWLLTTLDDEEPVPAVETPFAAAPPPPPPAPILSPVPDYKPPVSPAPVPAAAQIDVAGTLQRARGKVSGGDLDNAMIDYESVVRSNSALDDVVGDLSKLMSDERHKKNPAIYRVLGDGLMRQGKLQAALETYRRALNLL